MKKFTSKIYLIKFRSKIMWTWRGKAGRINWETGISTYTLPCVKQLAPGKQLYSTRSSILLCDDLEVWDEGSGRKEAQDGGEID